MELQGLINIIFSLLTLTLLEIVLGIDNLVFISIFSHRLVPAQQKKARRFGLLVALITRLLLLAAAVWLADLTKPLVVIYQYQLSIRDLFFIIGGIFLLIKSIHEIHHEYEAIGTKFAFKKYSNFFMIVIQIGIFDIIFSLDSILTAIGLTQNFWVMAVAITLAIILMLFSSEILSKLIHQHPTIKMLALSFLLLIGTALIADGLHFHIPRGYIYFAVCFSLLVEVLNNLIAKKKSS
jgi:predicted tellurium resistance membrane protein TerC